MIDREQLVSRTGLTRVSHQRGIEVYAAAEAGNIHAVLLRLVERINQGNQPLRARQGASRRNDQDRS